MLRTAYAYLGGEEKGVTKAMCIRLSYRNLPRVWEMKGAHVKLRHLANETDSHMRPVCACMRPYAACSLSASTHGYCWCCREDDDIRFNFLYYMESIYDELTCIGLLFAIRTEPPLLFSNHNLSFWRKQENKNSNVPEKRTSYWRIDNFTEGKGKLHCRPTWMQLLLILWLAVRKYFPLLANNKLFSFSVVYRMKEQK